MFGSEVYKLILVKTSLRELRFNSCENSDHVPVFDLVNLKPKVCSIYLERYFLGHNQDLFLKQTSIIKAPFTVDESESEKDQRQNDKHQKKVFVFVSTSTFAHCEWTLTCF